MFCGIIPASMGGQISSGEHREAEWQFDAPDIRSVGRWLEGLSGDEPAVTAGETRLLTDTYLDTGDWRLYRAGYSLRLRRRGERAEITMKSLASEDGGPGLRVREEISEPVEGPDLGDLRKSPGPAGERLRALIGGRALRPIFEVRTCRSAYTLSLDGAEVGELALDETTIPLEDGQEPAALRRVEVEVEFGALERVAPFVEEMREGCRLRPATTSKYEAGLLARGLRPPGPPEFGPTGVDASLTVGEVAFAILRQQFAVFLAHEPGTRIGEDPEELHDMRVAGRRMRAAMQIFEDALPRRAGKLREELKWIAGVLGEVRDLDVQLGQLEEWISEAEDREPLAELRAVLEERRGRARKAMLRALDSRRYARLVEAFTGMLGHGPARRSRAGTLPVLAAAPDLVRRRYRKVCKIGDAITEESPAEDYHELRKRGKRLRYALEFLSGVYGDPARDLIKPLRALQDVLGDHQDAVVAISHLRELATAAGGSNGLSPPAIFVMGGIARCYETRAEGLRAQFPEAYAGIRGKRWKKLEKTMEDRRPVEAAES